MFPAALMTYMMITFHVTVTSISCLTDGHRQQSQHPFVVFTMEERVLSSTQTSRLIKSLPSAALKMVDGKLFCTEMPLHVLP